MSSMCSIHSELIELIEEYRKSAAEAVEILRSRFKVEDIMRWKSCGIPRSGIIDSKYHYAFHGIGCTFDFGRKEVMFDFSDHGEIDGFNQWFLSCFAESYAGKFEKWRNTQRLNEEFSRAIDSGLIARDIDGEKYHLTAN